MEIKTLPDRPCGPGQVWECDDGRLCDADWFGGKLYVRWNDRGIKNVEPELASSLPPGRYRLRTLPDEPWPKEVKVEERRMVMFRNCTGFSVNLYRDLVSDIGGGYLMDEIRDCEADEQGVVIRVLPEGGE